jgi:hypothetical protein
LPPGDQPSTRRWDAENARCVRDLGRTGDYAAFAFERPLVRAIEIVAVTPEDGVTAAARVRLQLNGERDRTLHLVQFRGLWRVVIPLPTRE